MSDTYDGEDYTEIEITEADRHLFEPGDDADALAHKVLRLVEQRAKGLSKGMQLEVELAADIFRSVGAVSLARSVDQLAPHYGLKYSGHSLNRVARFEFKQLKG